MANTQTAPVTLIESLIEFIASTEDPSEMTDCAMQFIKSAGYSDEWIVRQVQYAYERQVG